MGRISLPAPPHATLNTGVFTMPLLPFVQDLNAYCKCSLTSLLKFVEKCNLDCCGSRRIHWGTYKRFILTETEKVLISVRRIYCKICTKTASFLPPFVLRYRRWYLDVLGQAIEELATRKISLFRVWSLYLQAEMTIKTFSSLLHRVIDCSFQVQDRLQSWLSSMEADFQFETIEKRHELLEGPWFHLGYSVIIIKAFNNFRRLSVRKSFSVMGLLFSLWRNNKAIFPL